MGIALDSLPKRLIGREVHAIGAQPKGTAIPGPYRFGTSRRQHVDPNRGRGYEDLVRLGDGFHFSACERTLHVDEPVNYVGEDYFKLHFRLAGESLILLPDGGTQEVRGPLCAVMLQPEGVAKGELNGLDVAKRCVSV